MGGVPCHLVTQTLAAHGNLMNEPQPRVTCGPLRTHVHSILSQEAPPRSVDPAQLFRTQPNRFAAILNRCPTPRSQLGPGVAPGGYGHLALSS